LRSINDRNLFLSLDPVPLEDVDEVFASPTIGLAFYRDIDENYSQIAMASGKLGFYLKHGKPVLVSNNESMRNFIDRTGVGIVISDPADAAEVRAAIAQILAAYDTYSSKARACFEQEFDFARNVLPLVAIFRNMADT
jgi:glycosyltransferase involved in cell wall biosynthesis